MEMSETKKLKRGLKELSPLFGTAPQMVVPQKRLRPETEILTVSVFNPDEPENSFPSSSYLARCVNASGYPSALVLLRSAGSNGAVRGKNGFAVRGRGLAFPSAHEEPVFSVKQHDLDWHQLDHLSSRSGTVLNGKILHPQVLFLDFDYRYMTYFKRMTPILDKWVLHLRPATESLNEAYKMLKVSAVINPHLEYYLLFDGVRNDQRGEKLFELFSDMVSRRLGLAIGWLGNFQSSHPGDAGGVHLALENFFMKSVDRVDSLEKIALAHFLQSAMESPMGIAV